MTAKDDPSTVALPAFLDVALGRVTTALDRLQAALDDRAEAQAGRADADDEAGFRQDDRTRLAAELDAALARAARLEGAHAEVVARLERAEAAIRTVAGGLAATSPEETNGGEA